MSDVMEHVRVEALADGAALVSLPRSYMENWISSRLWDHCDLTPEAVEAVFDRDGNLVDLSSGQDGPAMLALVSEAQAIAVGLGALPAQVTMTSDQVIELLQQAVALNEECMAPGDLKTANAVLGWVPKSVTEVDQWFSERWDTPSPLVRRDLRMDVTTTDGRPVAFIGREDGTQPVAEDLAAYRVMAGALGLLRARNALQGAMGLPHADLPLSQFEMERPLHVDGGTEAGVTVRLEGLPDILIRRPAEVEQDEFTRVLAIMASGPELLRQVQAMVTQDVAPHLAAAVAAGRNAVEQAQPVIKAVHHDGLEHFRGSENECFRHLFRVQANSVEYALQHGGWSLEDTAPDAPVPLGYPGR